MEKLAPSSIALPGDPVGLQIGNPDAEVNSVLVALDPDQDAVEEAVSVGAEMIVTHHPLFYQKLSFIDESLPGGALVASAIRNNLHIFSAHTNYDVAPNGVSYQLAEALGLQPREAEVLEVTGSEQLLKLVVFVPVGHEDRLRDALTSAGAGHIGRYSHCFFQTGGIGTFMAGEGSNPHTGIVGQLEKTAETRLETILPATRRAAVIKALLETHPYEEAAYDLYPLDLEGRSIGLGLVLDLDKPVSMNSLAHACRERLSANLLRCLPSAKKEFKRIALCGGSGASLIDHAVRKKADLLISGDFRYHDLKQAYSLGLALIDAGHAETELPGISFLRQYLTSSLKSDGYKAEIHIQASTQTGWGYKPG